MSKKEIAKKDAVAVRLPAKVSNLQEMAQVIQASASFIEARLPGGMTIEWFGACVVDGFNKLKANAKGAVSFNPDSVQRAVLTAAHFGIDPSGTFNSGHFVPYGNSLSFQIGFNGLRELAMRSGEVVSVDAHVVYDGEECAITAGSSPDVVHVIDLGKRGNYDNITGAYCLTVMTNGTKKVEVMAREDLERVRKASQTPKTVWDPWFTEMCRKAVLKRAMKHVPLSAEDKSRINEAFEQDNQAMGFKMNVVDIAPAAPLTAAGIVERLETPPAEPEPVPIISNMETAAEVPATNGAPPCEACGGDVGSSKACLRTGEPICGNCAEKQCDNCLEVGKVTKLTTGEKLCPKCIETI